VIGPPPSDMGGFRDCSELIVARLRRNPVYGSCAIRGAHRPLRGDEMELNMVPVVSCNGWARYNQAYRACRTERRRRADKSRRQH
jgi:hypothetical protein